MFGGVTCFLLGLAVMVTIAWPRLCWVRRARPVFAAISVVLLLMATAAVWRLLPRPISLGPRRDRVGRVQAVVDAHEALVAAAPFQDEVITLKDRLAARNKAKKILLLAYPRSGSSFLGELLSASSGAAYFFEPLGALRPNNRSINDERYWSETVKQAVKEFIDGIFNCQRWTYEVMSSPSAPSRCLRKNTSCCSCAETIVIKTIRLHWNNLQPWIHRDVGDIKVVHLVRDPRAVVHSLAQQPDTWRRVLRNVDKLCARMQQDLQLNSFLPGDRYLRVRYEDIVDSMKSSVRRLYAFMGVEMRSEVTQFVRQHMDAQSVQVNVSGTWSPFKKHYYSTFRRAGFKHDTWRDSLDKRMIRQVEQSCSHVMHTLGYEEEEYGMGEIRNQSII